MSRKTVLKVILVVGGVAVAAALGISFVTIDRNSDDTARLSPDSTFVEPGTVPIGGPFTLTDHTGRAVTEKDFAGKYLLIFFGFTYCPDVCPTTLAEIARTMDLLGEYANAVQPLFISVDPERDTPATLAEYIPSFDDRIVGLTGSVAQIQAVAESYRVYYEKVPNEADSAPGAATEKRSAEDYTVSHQANTYLMSPENEYLTHFSYGTGPEQMAETIRDAIEKFGRPPGG